MLQNYNNTRECHVCGIPLFDDEHFICSMCQDQEEEFDYIDEEEDE